MRLAKATETGLVGVVSRIDLVFDWTLRFRLCHKYGLADVESLGRELGPRDPVLLGQSRRLVRLAESTQPKFVRRRGTFQAGLTVHEQSQVVNIFQSLKFLKFMDFSSREFPKCIQGQKIFQRQVAEFIQRIFQVMD